VTTKYGQLTPALIAKLKKIIGETNVLTQEEEREKYTCDEMPVPKPHLPDVVVKPTDTESVAKVMVFANEHKIPVTPRGGGTGLVGGAVPIFGGILLSLERMNKIIEIDTHNFVAVVEAGVTLSDLYKAAEEHGLYYPVYPGETNATVGGTVATNAGGMRAVKYGVTRHFVLGLTAVLSSGQIIRTGGKFVKYTTGYDLTQLLVGSEGTLAIITETILRLNTPPAKTEVLFIPFPSIEGAIDTVPEILRLGNLPAGIEFMERDIIEKVREHTGKEIPHHEHPAFLMIILETDSQEALHEAARAIQEVATKHGAIDVFLPPSERAKRELLEAREQFYPVMKRLGILEIGDAVVPRSRIPDFVKRIKLISTEHGMPIIAYGHAGDGNVHLHPLGHGMDREEWNKKLPGVFKDIYQAAKELGGTVSGEHGIGIDKKAYLSANVDKDLIQTMVSIKKALDPNLILNPGKILNIPR